MSWNYLLFIRFFPILSSSCRSASSGVVSLFILLLVLIRHHEIIMICPQMPLFLFFCIQHNKLLQHYMRKLQARNCIVPILLLYCVSITFMLADEPVYATYLILLSILYYCVLCFVINREEEKTNIDAS